MTTSTDYARTSRANHHWKMWRARREQRWLLDLWNFYQHLRRRKGITP